MLTINYVTHGIQIKLIYVLKRGRKEEREKGRGERKKRKKKWNREKEGEKERGGKEPNKTFPYKEKKEKDHFSSQREIQVKYWGIIKRTSKP